MQFYQTSSLGEGEGNIIYVTLKIIVIYILSDMLKSAFFLLNEIKDKDFALSY